jgi:hypothetical protein
MDYRGNTYASFKALWHSIASTSHANETTAADRLHRRLQEDTASDELLDECLLLNAYTYRKRYGARKSYVNTMNGLRNVRELYDSQCVPINYATFRQRLKNLERRSRRIGNTEIREAATLSSSDWVTRRGLRIGLAPAFGEIVARFLAYCSPGLLPRFLCQSNRL